MFLVGLLQWWYGRGWKSQLLRARDQLLGVSEFFSIGQLLGTLFSPFRQISAGQVNGPIGVQLRAFVDKLVSRFIGAFVRLFTVLAGTATMLVLVVIELLLLVGWLLLPLFPVIGIIMFAVGWAPRWI